MHPPPLPFRSSAPTVWTDLWRPLPWVHCSEAPTLWLNASAASWTDPVVVNWPYPAADASWIPHWEQKLNQPVTVLADSSLCSLLQVPAAAAAVKGVVMYEASASIDALQWIAATAAGVFDAVPVTASVLAANPCLKDLPVLFTVPPASTFGSDLAAYAWMIKHVLSLMKVQPSVLVGACRTWKNYTCGWDDPLGAAAIDYAIARTGIVVNLDAAEPAQAAVLKQIGDLLPRFGIVTGWMEPEDVM
jgi:hypothetical protein